MIATGDDMFRAWEDLTEVEQLQSEFSDCYKEIYNFRPSAYYDSPEWNDATWLREQLVKLEDQAARELSYQEASEFRAIESFEKKVCDVISVGAKDRETAIRWILDANDALDDPEILAYSLGLPYDYFKKAA